MFSPLAIYYIPKPRTGRNCTICRDTNVSNFDIVCEVWRLATALFTWVWLKNSGALQSHGAASRRTTAPTNHASHSPRSSEIRYSFPIPVRVERRVGLITHYVRNLFTVACLLWTGWASNPRPLGYESDTLPLYHCIYHVSKSRLLSRLNHFHIYTVGCTGDRHTHTLSLFTHLSLLPVVLVRSVESSRRRSVSSFVDYVLLSLVNLSPFFPRRTYQKYVSCLCFADRSSFIPVPVFQYHSFAFLTVHDTCCTLSTLFCLVSARWSITLNSSAETTVVFMVAILDFLWNFLAKCTPRYRYKQV